MKQIIKKIGKNNYRIEEFESVLELTNANKTREVNEHWENRSMDKSDISKSWEGVSSYDEAYELLANGWEQETKKMANLVDKITKTGMKSKTSFVNNVHGFTPNVPLSIMNVPTSMIDVQRTQIKSKVINIIYDSGASCCESTESMLKAGLNMINTIINLELSGYRVNLKVMDCYCDSESIECCLVNIKNANQSFNLKKMMFPLAHSAWLRVIGFDWEDKSPITTYKGGRGCPYYVELRNRKVDRNDFKEIFGDTTFYINYKDASEGVENLEKIIKKH